MPRFDLSKISSFPLCFFLTAWLGGTLLVGCAPFASVGVVVPSPPIALVADQSTEELKQARSEMKVSEELAKTNPKAAMAQSEAAAMLSLDAQKNLSGPRADEVTAFYNYSVARLVEPDDRIEGETVGEGNSISRSQWSSWSKPEIRQGRSLYSGL